MTPPRAPSGRSGKRARTVCVRCHDKKIRCDLERPGAACSACVADESACEYRPSGKGQRPAKAQKVGLGPSTARHRSIERSPAGHEELVEGHINGDINSVRTLLGHQAAFHSLQRELASSSKAKSSGSCATLRAAHDNFAPGVLSSYLQTYADSCYTWMPIIDHTTGGEASSSAQLPLALQHAIAAAAGTIRTPLLPEVPLPREHYERARQLFHSSRVLNTLTLLKVAVLLSTCNSPSIESSTDGSFWWVGLGIRLAQDLRLHRDPTGVAGHASPGLLRRIWWTLYARERTAALFQGRPCIIDEEYCSTRPPSLDDFPTNQSTNAHIFVHWIQLCRTMGQIQRHMLSARQTGIRIPTSDIAASLTQWISLLPTSIKLSIATAQNVTFDKDVYLLHLPYLTTVALVYLNTTGQDVPEISVAAVLAATCTARIIQDFLLRGSVRHLPEDSGWSIAIATTALMHICYIEAFKDQAHADIRILLAALEHMSTVWTSSRIMLSGLRKLIAGSRCGPSSSSHTVQERRNAHLANGESSFVSGANGASDLLVNDGVSWSDFFPFATEESSPLFGTVLREMRGTFESVELNSDLTDIFSTFWDDFTTEHPDWLLESLHLPT